MVSREGGRLVTGRRACLPASPPPGLQRRRDGVPLERSPLALCTLSTGSSRNGLSPGPTSPFLSTAEGGTHARKGPSRVSSGRSGHGMGARLKLHDTQRCITHGCHQQLANEGSITDRGTSAPAPAPGPAARPAAGCRCSGCWPSRWKEEGVRGERRRLAGSCAAEASGGHSWGSHGRCSMRQCLASGRRSWRASGTAGPPGRHRRRATAAAGESRGHPGARVGGPHSSMHACTPAAQRAVAGPHRRARSRARLRCAGGVDSHVVRVGVQPQALHVADLRLQCVDVSHRAG